MYYFLLQSNKPFMEKKRRARINSCLGQLKTLVLQAMRKDVSSYSYLIKCNTFHHIEMESQVTDIFY